VAVRRWVARVTELPPAVQKEARKIEALGAMLYPYWEVDVLVHVKAPFLPRVSRRWRAAVDGITGQPSVLQPDLPVTTAERPDDADPGAAAGPSTGILSVTPFALTAEQMDRERLRQALWPYASRRLRSWANVSLEIGEVRPVYKALRLFAVEFRNGSRALLALDTVTGEYGVAPPDALAVVRAPQTAGGEAGKEEA